jgi:hypothetical protein
VTLARPKMALKKIEVTTVYAVVYRAAVRWKCIAHKAKYIL